MIKYVFENYNSKSVLKTKSKGKKVKRVRHNVIKKRTRNILILVLCIYALIGIVFFFYVRQVQSDFTEEITVEINGTTTSVLKMGELNLKPSESRDYAVNLKSKSDGEYKIDLNFSETTDGKLKDFINAEIACGEKKYTKTLRELLSGEDTITFICSLKGDVATRILIHYYMPIEVGNEAQGAVADFNVALTATYA